MTAHTLPEPIQEFVDATNVGDTERFVAAFADDAHVNDWGREFTGHDGVRDWNRTDNIGKRTRFAVIGLERDAEVYAVTVDVSGDGFNGRSPLVFTLRDGRIAELRIS